MKAKFIEHLLKNKILYRRLMYAIALIGIILLLVMKDNSFTSKYFNCDSKSKFNIEVKK